ncbi:MAG TPA: TonB-dependent receptor, partial [Burkholderiaceae bacterium]|nr:TonB-dependent receptor [Burkholderiaceae bacterium]
GGGELTPYATIGGGSHDSYESTAGVSGGGERSWFNVSASGTGTGGINACDANLSGGCFVDEPDKDGYRNQSGTVRVGHRFGQNTELDFHYLRAEGDNRSDGSIFSGNESDTLEEVYGTSLRFAPIAAWLATVQAGRSRDEIDSFKDSVFVSRFNTQRESVSFQNDFTLAPKQLVTIGTDYVGDRISSSTAYPVTSRRNDGLFTQYQGGFGAHDVQLSLRRDDNEQFGNESTGSAAWGYAFSGGARVTLSYGTAFKAPSFNELYFPFFGTPTLEPEQSETSEVGVSNKHGWGRWAINAYETDVDQLSGFDTAFRAINIDLARIRGVEGQLNWHAAEWEINSVATWLDPENRTEGANVGKVLPRRAQRIMRIDVDRRIGQFRVGTRVQAEGHRYDDLANARRLGGYTTVDLLSEYAVTKRWLLQARIENMLDKDYETAKFFNQPGRGYFFTLRYQP